MKTPVAKGPVRLLALLMACGVLFVTPVVSAADKLNAIYTARVMSQSMPWVAQEAGLFKKHDLDVQLIFVTPGAPAVATMLTGDSELSIQGAGALSRALVQGNKEVVFIGGIKNVLTHSFLAKPEIKKAENLKGKRIGVSRIGSNPHYFAVQALRRFGLESRDVSFIQTGGAPETLAALVAHGIDAAVLTSPTDSQALGLGYQYVIYGPDLRIPYAATTFNTRRSVIAKRPQVLARFMRAMAESAKILHTDKEYTFKILRKYLRVDDRKILEAAYNAEIKALEPRLALKLEALQANLDEIAPVEPRAKNVKPQELVDNRFLEEMEKSGFFDRLWGEKK
ncbi:MAG: ABC transporter substrate-binding protein [Deltaproteobacteria bacterium]|nr:ABC transporter substrate-binding protein [Deltaproteobacteria bacterium]MBI2349456.1 ABC transporter substrate-binding protein [Deltaproteobacteria bacterium]MBI2990966.1 ABC transporter substrate-binding protein [Deltaproteobacteria bacterium]